MTYANAFNPQFFLLLRERRAISLAHMQDAALEVESNILVADKLRGKADKDRGKDRSENLTSSSSITPAQTDEMAKMLKSVSARMEKIELEGKKNYINPQNVDNRGNIGSLTILLRLCKDTRGAEIEMIKKSRPLSKIIFLLMN
jgi:hypothetical protein